MRENFYAENTMQTESCMGWRIPSLSIANFLSCQLSHLTTVPYFNLAMAAKPPHLITGSFTTLQKGACMGWRIPSLSKTNFLRHQLSHLTTVPYIHLAMATKPHQLIKASFTRYKDYDIIFSCNLLFNELT